MGRIKLCGSLVDGFTILVLTWGHHHRLGLFNYAFETSIGGVEGKQLNVFVSGPDHGFEGDLEGTGHPRRLDIWETETGDEEEFNVGYF